LKNEFCNKCGQSLPPLEHQEKLIRVFGEDGDKVCPYCGHNKLTKDEVDKRLKDQEKYFDCHPEEYKKFKQSIDELFEKETE